jgi:hypothetical protein
MDWTDVLWTLVIVAVWLVVVTKVLPKFGFKG